MAAWADRRRNPDPARPVAAKRCLAAALALTLSLAVSAPGSAGEGGQGGQADGFVRDAHAALSQGDGIAAEAALRKAIAAGLARDAAAARMGEAYLAQGDLAKAREWLGAGRFAPAEAAHGWRMLGRLELAERHLAAAGRAFDRALQLTPQDSRLWVDIARLRYSGGEQLLAIAAADRAVALDPGNVRALEFRGLLVRDQYGFAAALPWFEAGLKVRPDDLALLGEYAATLGELGRARDMLVVTRRMIALEPDHPRAFFLQAVLAARAGNVALARTLLRRAGPAMAQVPAAMMLQGALELQAGNANAAAALLDRLARQQPRNARAKLLLARALHASGDRRQLLDRFADEAGQPGASAYLLTLLGRTYEDLGQRDLAAPLLDRAAIAGEAPFARTSPEPPGETPGLGFAADQLLAGDERLDRGDLAGAREGYRRAATIRLTDGLLVRLVVSSTRDGRWRDAEKLVAQVLSGSPRNRTALRLAAGFAARRGDWARAAHLLEFLAATGSGADARLLADLSFARLRSGNVAGAQSAGEQAYRLQRAAPASAKAWGIALSGGVSTDVSLGQALLAKARAGNL
ncbi:MAG: tetratricopeptide repeat protein [Sphingomonadales bacterium]|nr:tetratricopeptide repeat protein [Sphingomonadales bacterium]MBU3991906.1 tetratricopeptide repeat protein [Alphaproteobacteria bacterium]